MDFTVIRQAYSIALRDLRVNYGACGIYAGQQNFREYWARDGSFSMMAAALIGDFDIVRRNLALFREHQRADGHIPLRVEERSHSLALVGIRLPYSGPRARHRSSALWSTDAVDTPALYILAGCDYAAKSGDAAWLEDNAASMLSAAGWLLARKNHLGLIDEGLVANVADQTFKTGSVTYTNVCVWKALTSLEAALDGRGIAGEAGALEQAILEHLWLDDRGHFADWLGRKGKLYGHFSSDGNVLAAVFGLAGEERARRICQYIDDHRLAEPLPLRFCHPHMDSLNDLFARALFRNYSTDNIFGWLGPLAAMARLEARDSQGALADLERYAAKVVEIGTRFEVLTSSGEEVRLPYYRSERQFAWAAASTILAVHRLADAGVLPKDIL